MSSNNMINDPLRADGRRPSAFLSLAPTTSSTYPIQKLATAASRHSQEQLAGKSSSAVDESSLTEDTATVAESNISHRRTSSTSTASSSGSVNVNAGVKFLTLGPVHGGEHEDGNGDWSVAE